MGGGGVGGGGGGVGGALVHTARKETPRVQMQCGNFLLPQLDLLPGFLVSKKGELWGVLISGNSCAGLQPQSCLQEAGSTC